MNKFMIFIIGSFFFLTSIYPDTELPSDLSGFQNGGKITSPAGTYGSGGATPSDLFSGFIKKLGIYLKENPRLVIDIRGHSDDRGTDRINESISVKRAEWIKDLLIEHSGIQTDRIITRGYADNVPLKSNESEAGRMENRRVELFLTNNKTPVGEITHIMNDVFTKPPELRDFKKAEVLEVLFNLYKLNTMKKSGANIRLSDESKLNIGPESLMVIYEKIDSEPSSPDAWKDKKVKLLTGFLRTKLNELRNGIKIETPQCSIESRSTIMLLDISPEKKSAISVFDGESDVKAAEKTVKVESGFGTFVDEGKAPAKPEPLPVAPILNAPLSGSVFTGRDETEIPVELKWESAEPLTHIQISEDREFTKIIADEKVTGGSFAALLKGGSYYWRAAGINTNGIEGFPAHSDFSVSFIRDKVPLELSPEGMETPLDAHGSTAVVKTNTMVITGTTLPGSSVLINYERVDVGPDGKFSKRITLGRGWNIINVKASLSGYKRTEQWISVCYFKKYRSK